MNASFDKILIICYRSGKFNLRLLRIAAPEAVRTGWYKGRVKAVPSGDSLVVTAMASNRPGPPPEKIITLASLIAPRLARRGGVDEPFAWESREFLRKLCIGKEVTFRVEYAVPSIGREFGSIYLGDKNVAILVLSQGWAKVREQGQQKGEASPILAELLLHEEQAKQDGLGRWSKVPGASEASIRNLPPSSIGDPSNLDAMGLLAANKGKPMECIVEQVRDGSTVRVYLLPDFHFVQVFVAGIQSPSMGGRAAPETVIETDLTSDEQNGDASAEPRASLTSAQRLSASAAASVEVSPDPFGPEAKHFTEVRCLNRDVRIVLEGVDKFSNLIGSVYYPDGETAKDLALELVENAIRDQNFTGKVVEVVSGDFVIVVDDSAPYGSPLAERRLNFSSIRCPKIGNPRRDEKPAAYAREAREFFRTRLIGKQVTVQMEYSRKVTQADGATAAAVPTDSRVMDFGSVFLTSPVKGDGDDAPAAVPSTTGSQPPGLNVAELVVGRGFGSSPAKKARDFLHFLQHKRIPAVVEYVLSGHRFKLLIPKETCSIAFSFSGVRCAGRDEPYSDEVIAVMRRRIMQRDVEILVETVDRTGTFLGIADAHLLDQAEQSAKWQKLKIWENYVEGEEVSNGSPTVENKQKEILEVVVTEVLSGGKFYVQTIGDQRVSSIQKQLASLNIQEAPVIDLEVARMVLAAEFNCVHTLGLICEDCQCTSRRVGSSNDRFEVFYLDYGNQEEVPYSRLRPIDPSLSATPGLAQLCSLVFLKVPSLEDKFGTEAAQFLSEQTFGSSLKFKAVIEERDSSGGKVKGQGTGTVLIEGLARLEKRKKWEPKDIKLMLNKLEEYQQEAKTGRRGIWQYGDVESDDEDILLPVAAKKTGGRR
ncbi:TUDOR-SN protein 1 isoform 2 [Hibiscus syriacus]|uniref:Ribonuclease n=1 Tax=Hibiscus syriacus TaxID=106335 RepID=A0A6A2Y226_HIBSY|nr:TUDOR-SN protein 1 isoform 2 [Hibiscus syriacus]